MFNAVDAFNTSARTDEDYRTIINEFIPFISVLSNKTYDKEFNKHARILLYGGIVWIIVFIFIISRKEYNYFLMEILVSKMFIEPIVYILIIALFFFLKSAFQLFVMTRKSNRILGRIRIRRGIRDEIERLENEIWKIELEIDKFEEEMSMK